MSELSYRDEIDVRVIMLRWDVLIQSYHIVIGCPSSEYHDRMSEL